MKYTNRKYSRVEIFQGPDLPRVVDKAITSCPQGYEVYDLDVKFLKDEYVVIAKIQKEEP
ncbi:hypothetical protein EYY48_14795 [Enterococcus faecalis]|nr:hypothetical protein AQ486_13475 [Enterococcus faecalis]BDP65005.1 hypothetical protein EfmJHP80_25010 [Enterococcus faecium]MBC2813558.1 hypothetical protein [Enterococcus faecalis]MBC2818479.1 hypothetical protein [Enterococcus faecalis]MBC2833741.1 hypothetical protein [Enterococcus faecalis]